MKPLWWPGILQLQKYLHISFYTQFTQEPPVGKQGEPHFTEEKAEVGKADLKVTPPPAPHKRFLGPSLGFLLLHWSNLSDVAFDSPATSHTMEW